MPVSIDSAESSRAYKTLWARGECGSKAREVDVPFHRTIVLSILQDWAYGCVWRRLCRVTNPPAFPVICLQIISEEWGREGKLVVRIMLQLSLFRMHTVAFLWEDYCPRLLFPCIWKYICNFRKKISLAGMLGEEKCFVSLKEDKNPKPLFEQNICFLNVIINVIVHSSWLRCLSWRVQWK